VRYQLVTTVHGTPDTYTPLYPTGHLVASKTLSAQISSFSHKLGHVWCGISPEDPRPCAGP
jgi:hypothetical protein